MTSSHSEGLVITFYGYLNELGGHRIAGSGHLALGKLLKDTNVDGIVSPYKYSMVRAIHWTMLLLECVGIQSFDYFPLPLSLALLLRRMLTHMHVYTGAAVSETDRSISFHGAHGFACTAPKALDLRG